MSTPTSQIKVCSGVRLTNAYRHTIYFSSREEQRLFFEGKVVHGFPDYTYLRKNWSIKVETTMENALTWDYLFFTNSSDGKEWYYFITNIQYLNDNTVELFLELDVMQTYLFDYELLPCFVEREHAATDMVGLNVVDEDLELGEYVVASSSDASLAETSIMLLCTSNPEYAANNDLELNLEFANMYDGVFSGLSVYRVPSSDATTLGTILTKLDDAGKSECIVSMWMYPSSLIKSESSGTTKKVTGKKDANKEISRGDSLGPGVGYTPRNKKLLTYPYNFLYVTNNCGGAAVYHYEHFADWGSCNFRIVGSITPDAAVRCYPLNYKNEQHAFEEGLSLANFPSCAWDSDMYKLWLAQNQHQLQNAASLAVVKAVGGVVTAGVSLATGNLAGVGAGAATLYSGLADINGQMAMKKDKAIQPEQAKGNYSSTVNTAAGFQTFTFKKKSITIPMAQKLDAYFDMYGYRTLAVKVPNRAVRENWTFTKTIGCTIRGAFCVEDRTKIESIFDNGITFWKNGNSIGDYSLSNACE